MQYVSSVFSTSWWTDNVALYGSTTVSETYTSYKVENWITEHIWNINMKQEKNMTTVRSFMVQQSTNYILSVTIWILIAHLLRIVALIHLI